MLLVVQSSPQTSMRTYTHGSVTTDSLCYRSLLRFLSHAAQVTGQCLVHMGTYMLRVLAETEEQAVPGSRPWRGIKRG